MNFRLKWTVRPGNDVFVILNQGYDADSNHIVPTQTAVAAKAVWTFRF
ncbi:hypothetical protein OH491_01645 [Termitidicoccus mucosus]